MKVCVVYECEWRWVPEEGIRRAHWLSTDGTNIRVVPPSGSCTVWMVVVPLSHEKDELTASMESEVTAFHYAARTRKARAN